MSYKQNNPLSRKNSPLNKDDKWIQKATESIKERGTEGVCTGDKFGGPTCPPGSKRYNLAVTFKKMAKKRKDGPSRKSSEDKSSPLYNASQYGIKGVNESDWLKYGGDVIDETAQKDEGSPLYNAANIYGGWKYSRELRDMPLTKDMTKRDN